MPLTMTLALQPITIGGIPIPSRDPFFLALVAIHVAAGLMTVGAGAVAMLSHKTAGRHPRSGTVYWWALVVACASMAVVALVRWPADNALAALGILAFASALVGRLARRRAWTRWTLIHIPGMGASYVLMLTAFYVDNGPHLPLWSRLPALAFWLVPAAVGTPLIVAATSRYRRLDAAAMPHSRGGG